MNLLFSLLKNTLYLTFGSAWWAIAFTFTIFPRFVVYILMISMVLRHELHRGVFTFLTD